LYEQMASLPADSSPRRRVMSLLYRGRLWSRIRTVLSWQLNAVVGWTLPNVIMFLHVSCSHNHDFFPPYVRSVDLSLNSFQIGKTRRLYK
jgi:hypothetical protein